MSTLLIAAMFSRINNERLAKGKEVVEFVDPVLYKNPDLFNDIVVGNMDGTRYSGNCRGSIPGSSPQGNGFSAAEGWDPVSGLGTPTSYPDLLEYFIKLPSTLCSRNNRLNENRFLMKGGHGHYTKIPVLDYQRHWRRLQK